MQNQNSFTLTKNRKQKSTEIPASIMVSTKKNFSPKIIEADLTQGFFTD
ncbi:hypothetical protein MNB_SUP05-SYMBIONT-5-568 [hydrothermal vent metagenome]|uniref:Uncharacterized protein n=1 Tax=hydrothermal vent metagenome TaxID=652676 RepID=A0A1W1E4J8_9ZZZZ